MSSANGRPPSPLAGRLKALREHEWPDAGLTQSQLAKALGGPDKAVAPATLSTWESATSPKTPPTTRLIAYAQFFATRRSLEGVPHLVALEEFDPEERTRFEDLQRELIGLHASLGRAPTERRLLMSFDDPGPIVIVCPEAPEDARGPLANKSDPNYTPLHRFADADALIEMFGHIRSQNPDQKVMRRLPSDTHASDLQNHLVILGGIGWNSTLKRIQSQLARRLPIEQFEDKALATGEVFRFRDGTGDGRTYYPVIEEFDGVRQVVEDIGLIARLRNPYSASRTLTICNGVHSTGVLGAVLTLTDETVRPRNEEYISGRFPSGEFAMLIRVIVVEGVPLAPDLHDPDVRVVEWSPDAAGA